MDTNKKASELHICKLCDFYAVSKTDYERHLLTTKHSWLIETNKKAPFFTFKKFSCDFCDFHASKKYDYDRHLTTAKHQRLTNAQKAPKKAPVKNLEEIIHYCHCGNSYKHLSSLCKHKKTCSGKKENDVVIDSTSPDIIHLITELIKSNNGIQESILEICKNGTHNTTNMNSHNKSFNLNFFLNETCKNAMNITDFMNSIQLQLSDLESVGKDGFINGISNIIVKNLKSLDITQRPVHCTDSKREVLYIKDENKWEKEGEENNKLRKAIKHVAYKNSKMLSAFREKHPDCNKSDSKYSDQYNKLVIEAMGGKGDNDKEKEDKIIKNIAREVIVEK
jgi:hypothetical protein